MWAFFALENVSAGACSQLDAIICSDIQKRVKRTVNSELPWIKKRKKKILYNNSRSSSISELILASDEKKKAQFISSVIKCLRTHRQ